MLNTSKTKSWFDFIFSRELKNHCRISMQRTQQLYFWTSNYILLTPWATRVELVAVHRVVVCEFDNIYVSIDPSSSQPLEYLYTGFLSVSIFTLETGFAFLMLHTMPIVTRMTVKTKPDATAEAKIIWFSSLLISEQFSGSHGTSITFFNVSSSLLSVDLKV